MSLDDRAKLRCEAAMQGGLWCTCDPRCTCHPPARAEGATHTGAANIARRGSYHLTTCPMFVGREPS